MRIELLWAVFPAIALAGCAGMNEQECLVTDWRSVGFEDGVAGRAVGAVGNYRQACSKYGVVPDLDAYRAGHAEGVEVYCRPARGFEVASQGVRYQGVCPADMEPEFLSAYTEGRRLYELDMALRNVVNQIAGRHNRAETLKKEMAAGSAAIVSDATPAEERARLLVETANMARELGEIDEEIAALEVERVLREQELSDYQATLAYGY